VVWNGFAEFVKFAIVAAIQRANADTAEESASSLKYSPQLDSKRQANHGEHPILNTIENSDAKPDSEDQHVEGADGPELVER